MRERAGQTAPGGPRPGRSLFGRSAGSFSAATLASALHQRAGAVSRPLTPLEFEGLGGIEDSYVMTITAGGNNSDILAAFEAAVRYKPAGVCVVCSGTGSRLARRASKERGAAAERLRRLQVDDAGERAKPDSGRPTRTVWRPRLLNRIRLMRKDGAPRAAVRPRFEPLYSAAARTGS